MTEPEINLPDTPDEVRDAIDAALSKVLTLDGGFEGAKTWLERIGALQRAAAEKWPDEGFEPYEPCPACEDQAGVACDVCER